MHVVAHHSACLRALGLSVLLAFIALFSGACAEGDFGNPCALPENDAITQACYPPSGQEDGEVSASCVVNNIIQCDSRVCGVYRGSNGFCTEECTADTDCPGDAFCTEFGPGSGVKYCALGELRNR